jgi:hypothetical protein
MQRMNVIETHDSRPEFLPVQAIATYTITDAVVGPVLSPENGFVTGLTMVTPPSVYETPDWDAGRQLFESGYFTIAGKPLAEHLPPKTNATASIIPQIYNATQRSGIPADRSTRAAETKSAILQERLQLGIGLFDRAHVGAVMRQISQLGPAEFMIVFAVI